MPTAAPTLNSPRTWQLVGLGGCAVVVVGSLGPWATVTTPFGTVNVAGTSGDGTLTIIAALGAAVGFITAVWLLRWIGVLCTIVVAIFDWQNLSSRIADVNSSTVFAHASVGWGLWAVLIGAVLGLIAAFAVPKRAKLVG